MRPQVLLRLLLMLMALAASTMVFPLLIALYYGEQWIIPSFALPMIGVILPAGIVLLCFRKQEIFFDSAGSYLLVLLSWICICLLGALPFYLSGCLPHFADALFESVSGFTTTGSTVIPSVEDLPRSLHFWRALTHWLGGMGVVVLTVALLPLLGVGGFQLLSVESPGPEADRIVPRITKTAKILWSLYILLTAAETLLLRLGGMNWFEAVFYSFSTMGTGGFSTRGESVAAYHSPYIEWVIIVFMLLAGFNFSLIYQALQGKFAEIGRNSEARCYALIVLSSVLIISLSLGSVPGAKLNGENIRLAFFHSATIITTTGFSSADIDLWPPLAQGVLFLLMFVGGCSGSTAGGIKVIRHLVLCKQTGNEIKRMLYPKGVFSIQLNKTEGKKEVVYGVAGFVFMYLLLLLSALLVTALAGKDIYTSMNVGLITLGNIGLGFGKLDGVIASLPGYTKGFLSLIMIAGRLELWSLVVLFSRNYWRR